MFFISLRRSKTLPPNPTPKTNKQTTTTQQNKKGAVDPCIEFVTGRLEGLLRETLPDDLALYPPE